MGLLRNISLGLAAGSGSPRRSAENPNIPLSSDALSTLLDGQTVEAGVPMSPAKALQLTAVYRAVSLVAGTCGGVPLHAYRTPKSAERVDVTDDFPVVRDPHPELPPFSFWEQVYVALEMHGNAYLRKVVVGGQVRYLLPLHPTNVRVGRAKDGSKVFEVRTNHGMVPLSPAEVLHIPGVIYDGTVGIGPIDAARQGLGLSAAAELYGARLFGKGTLSSGVLQTDRRLPPGAAEDLKQRWQQMFAGVDKSHEVAVIDHNAKFVPIQLSPEQAQFIATRQFGVVEVARLFGVPPVLLMESGDASNWGTGIQEQVRGFLVFSLAARLQRVAGWMTKAILPTDVHAEHVTAALLRADTLTRFKSYEIAIRNGWLSRNEVRKLENEAAGPAELDEFIVTPSPQTVRVEGEE